MTFADQITRAPIPHDTVLAQDALSHLGWASGRTRELLCGTAGCSPYLAGLMTRHRDWLETALDQDPAAVIAAEIAALQPGPASDTGKALRLAKQRVALLTGLADLGGVWGLDAVTGALTQLADRGTDVALKSALIQPLTRGKIPGQSLDDLDHAAGLTVLAMGKMGAFELNYSSDIDLICLFDDSRFDGPDVMEARAIFIKAVRQAMGLLSDNTGDGYVFRTDLRLRPDPSVTPVVVSITAAERYYEALGRAWERAAYVKARPCAGDLKAGHRFLKDIRPFIWRRHLDFATIHEAQDMRLKIRAQKGRASESLDGRNVKLSPGGIREIEFFTQTRQLIAGGRDPELRMRETRRGLAALAEKGWVTTDVATTLDADYLALREMEHRLQMVQDAQTHALPSAEDGWQRLADFTGGGDVAQLKDTLRERFERVYALTEEFFAPERAESLLPEMTGTAEKVVDRWKSYPALRSERAQEIFARILPKLLAGFQRAADPDGAILQFDGFLRGLPAGVQVFSLFEANPQLIDLMVDISSTAPALAQYLSNNSGVLDAVIGGDFFDAWPGSTRLTEELTALLDNPDLDYELRLDTTRHWQKDWHFRIGVHHLRGLISPDEAAAEYSDLAEAVVQGMWQATCAEFARKHGAVPGSRAIVLGMGSLGARKLGARSDLDLIVIYDAPVDAQSDGKRPLEARTYFARLTKALVTSLSAQTAAGTLYEVDMRLRPSGRQGPAAASWASFQTYQRKEAWTWEHLALTRARVVAGNEGLGEAFEDFRCKLLAEPQDRAKVLRDLADMRRRLSEAKPRSGVWDVSNGPGGLQDIELFGQAIALLAGDPETASAAQLRLETDLASPEARAKLLEIGTLLAAVKSVARLLTGRGLEPSRLGQGGLAMLLRDGKCDDLEALEVALDAATTTAAGIIDVAINAGEGADVA
ncbi:glutamine-synthetase adenylyltransferase [Fluviibacterium sp. DFM31]|uniref:Glutamine-synthetase adenylyltransferase n=1 Tax=Meridianimarinicoccus marinus TaxID=3231483 RepID=A0ABV3L595_9RHOB